MTAENRSTRGAVSKVLLDTNILLRLAQHASVDHVVARAAVIEVAQAQLFLCVVPQVIYEFWVAATRPVASNGLGWDIPTTESSVLDIVEEYQLLKDERGVFTHWQSLVSTYCVSGKTAHDARLVAAMKRHGIAKILTFNGADFRRYSDIEVLSPADVVSGKVQLG